ncbi:MAG: helix-turn-helix domain-containing protein [Magnetospirillum sp.]|nr:helix-turn-helix domain-containing protein [Magnetospirillum sp.]
MQALSEIRSARPAVRGRLCACLDASATGRIQAAAGDLRLNGGETVYAAGTAADAVFGIRQGAVALTNRLADGRRQVLAFLFGGDTFGFSADGTHGDSAETLGGTSLCRIPCSVIDQDRALLANLRAAAQAMLAAAWQHQVLLGRMTAFERVYRFLSDLWVRLGRPTELHMPMKVADIGDHLGLRPETVSRGLARLRRDGTIGPWNADGFIPVIDPGRLFPPRAAA